MIAKWISRLAIAVVAAALFAAATTVIMMRAKGIKFLTMETGSMEPNLPRGDLIVVKPLTDWPATGQVVSYNSRVNLGEVVTHRVKTVDPVRDYIVTKGDNTMATDQPIRKEQILGIVSFKSAKFGKVMRFLRHPAGLVLGLYVPALAVIVIELRHLFKAHRARRRHYAFAGTRRGRAML